MYTPIRVEWLLLMRISDFIARTITQRRALVWCGVAVLTIVCIAILLTSLRLDSEIFNVLPADFHRCKA